MYDLNEILIITRCLDSEHLVDNYVIQTIELWLQSSMTSLHTRENWEASCRWPWRTREFEMIKNRNESVSTAGGSTYSKHVQPGMYTCRDFPGCPSGKEPACQCRRWVRSLGREDPLEEGMAPHSTLLAWESHWQRSLAATVHDVTKSRIQLGQLSMQACVSVEFSSVQFSRSFVSNSLWPHESQHARPPCPSPTPGVHSDSCPLSQWCHPAISSSVVPFSSCSQSLPASGSFPVSQLFAWGGQSIRVSASASFLPVNTQDWSPLGWTGLITLQSKALSRVFSNTTVQKHQFFSAQLSSQCNSFIHTWPLEKP